MDLRAQAQGWTARTCRSFHCIVNIKLVGRTGRRSRGRRWSWSPRCLFGICHRERGVGWWRCFVKRVSPRCSSGWCRKARGSRGWRWGDWGRWWSRFWLLGICPSECSSPWRTMRGEPSCGWREGFGSSLWERLLSVLRCPLRKWALVGGRKEYQACVWKQCSAGH